MTMQEIQTEVTMPSLPKVTIICMSYNHEKYIARALDGFLMQEVDFPLEIIVHDDASPDGTSDIIREYQKRFPGRIDAVLQEENQVQKGISNLSMLTAQARGRYVALCEGDDYWLDPHKLRRQVAYMEAHPECSICSHRVLRVDAEDQDILEPWPLIEEAREYSIKDVLALNIIPTASVVYRNMPLAVWRQWRGDHKFTMGDWPLWVFLLTQGYGFHFSESMGAYRIHHGGFWSSASKIVSAKRYIGFHSCMVQLMDYPLNRISRRQLSFWYLSLSACPELSRIEELGAFCRSITSLHPLDYFAHFYTRSRRAAKILLRWLSLR